MQNAKCKINDNLILKNIQNFPTINQKYCPRNKQKLAYHRSNYYILHLTSYILHLTSYINPFSPAGISLSCSAFARSQALLYA